MKKGLCFTICILMATLLFAQSATENKVWRRVQALGKAVFETKDSLALLDLTDEKLTYGHSGGNIEDKAEMIHKAVSSKTTYKNSSFENISLNIENKTAIVRQNFRAISVDEKGAETPLDLSILQVWKKKGGKWQLWARQSVKIPPKNK
jgi:hypothetical protein